jgi:hypothetical protein
MLTCCFHRLAAAFGAFDLLHASRSGGLPGPSRARLSLAGVFSACTVAYVTFSKQSEAALALEQLNGAVLNAGRGPKLKVLLAEAPPTRWDALPTRRPRQPAAPGWCPACPAGMWLISAHAAPAHTSRDWWVRLREARPDQGRPRGVGGDSAGPRRCPPRARPRVSRTPVPPGHRRQRAPAATPDTEAAWCRAAGACPPCPRR